MRCFSAYSVLFFPAMVCADDLAEVRKFLGAHCVSCHGPDLSERKFRLDTLSDPSDEPDIFARWVKSFDKLSHGEMPPRGAEQPPAEEKKRTLDTLRKILHERSLARQKTEGRAVIRRLNRVEYQTTLSDLTGTPIRFADQLPDDSAIGGFDTVGRGLDFSAEHLLRYQDVAEKAVNSVIPTRPPTPIQSKRTGKQITELMPTFKESIGKTVLLDGDSLTLFVRPYGHIPCGSAAVPQSGTYRVRASIKAVNSDRPIPILMSCRDQYGRDDHDVRGVFDVTADRFRVIEGEYRMEARQIMVFTGWSLPDMREFGARKDRTPLSDYRGPGMTVEWVEIVGPIDSWPTAGYNTFFDGIPLKAQSVVRAEAAGRKPPDVSKRGPDGWIYDPMVMAPSDPIKEAERLIRRFVPTAFRRATTKEQEDPFVRIAHDALRRKEPFREAMIQAYKAILCSPHFLYLNRAPFDDYSLASRLSYCFWSTLPDRELLDLAAKNELSKPDVLRTQVERMLSSPKGARFRNEFAGQWLDLRNINVTSPDPQLYPEFDPFLFWSMPKETERYFDEMLRGNRPVAEFVHSDWSVLNQRLARHYGIEGIHGGELRKVTLPKDSDRGGVLTQAGILKVTADGTKTSPVLRGKWVLERIIGRPPEPPPPGTPGIEPDIRGATTIRQQLDKHRNIASCAHCHQHIDPPGFALESFDPIGGRRDFYRTNGAIRGKTVELANYPGRRVNRGPDVEPGGRLPDGRTFNGIAEYKRLLSGDLEQLARNLAEKLVVFATGAEIQFADRAEIDQILLRSRKDDYGFRTLVHEVVQSRLFRNK